MEQHTPTPWSEKDWYVISNHGHICEMMGPFGYEANKANARRIVAAVNACEGIPTELLEQGAGFWAKSNSHDEERDAAFSDLLRVNARLLEALRDIAKRLPETDAIPESEYCPEKDYNTLIRIHKTATAAISETEKTTAQ